MKVHVNKISENLVIKLLKGDLHAVKISQVQISTLLKFLFVELIFICVEDILFLMYNCSIKTDVLKITKCGAMVISEWNEPKFKSWTRFFEFKKPRITLGKV